MIDIGWCYTYHAYTQAGTPSPAERWTRHLSFALQIPATIPSSIECIALFVSQMKQSLYTPTNKVSDISKYCTFACTSIPEFEYPTPRSKKSTRGTLREDYQVSPSWLLQSDLILTKRQQVTLESSIVCWPLGIADVRPCRNTFAHQHEP